MASRNFQNRQYNFHVFPVQLDAQVSIGATGAPTLVTSGPSGIVSQGIASITRLAAGIYQLRLADNYISLLQHDVQFSTTTTGSAIAAGSLNPTTVYQITTMGTTTQAQWVTAGVPSTVTAAVGVVFKCAATSAGTGTATAVAPQNINRVDLVGNPNLMASQPFTQGNGMYITIMCVAPTDATTTTAIAADPTNGTTMRIRLLLSNSSIA